MGRLAWRVLLGAICMSALAPPGVAHAHADLLDSDPTAGAVVDESPERIVLTFTGVVDLVEDPVRLIASDGSEVALADVGQDGGDATMTATIPVTLSDGSYVIAWAALSADSHPISGAIPFSVGEPSGDIATLADQLTAGHEESAFNELLVGYGRLTSYAGALVLMGTAGVIAMVLPPLLAEQRTATLLLTVALMGAFGTVAMLAGQSHRINGSFVDWTAVVSTHAGLWWSLRLVVFVGALLAIADVRRLEAPPARIVGAAIALLTFAVVAAGGHGASGSSQHLGFVATVVHLLAAATWIGALLVLVVLAPRGERWTIASMVSVLALVSVVALSATGVFNSWRQLTGFGDLLDTGYGRWLAAKLVVLTVVLGFAGASRRAVHGRVIGTARTPVGRPGEVVDEDAARPPAAMRGLERTVMVEMGGVALILVLTVGLTSAVPPKSLEVSAVVSATAPVTATGAADDFIASVEVLPGSVGMNSLSVTIEPTAPGVTAPDEITVAAELVEADLGRIDVSVEPDGPGRVLAESVVFPAPGPWTVIVTARFGDFDQTVVRIPLDIDPTD